MFQQFFELIDRMDSFKRVALLLLTGLSCLCLYFGYLAVQNLTAYQSWKAVPHVVYSELPCNLVQIREDYYLISISFPTEAVPIDDQDLAAFTSSLWVRQKPKISEFKTYCRGLIAGINSNTAETILAPFQSR